jgi:rhodanese-related sulfurtransferase
VIWNPPCRRKRNAAPKVKRIIRNNAPTPVGYRDRPAVHVGHVEPTLADSAHCIWEEGNVKVYMGPARAAGAKAYESLVQAGVGAIINCTLHIPCHHRRHNIRYCQIPVRDHAGADILTYLPGATTFLDNNLRQGTSVLVHCEMGVSRSATVVLAYLMQYHNMTRDQSYVILKQRRPSINPNEGFWQQLMIWEHRTATTTTATTVTSTTAKTAAYQEPEPVDRDWAQSSSALYSTCREMEGPDLFHACFDRCLTTKDRKHTLEVCLDFVWGRGVSIVDVDWLAALCRFLAENGNGNTTSNDSSMASVSVQRQVLVILEDADSDFGTRWSCEIYPKQMERIQQALGL